MSGKYWYIRTRPLLPIVRAASWSWASSGFLPLLFLKNHRMFRSVALGIFSTFFEQRSRNYSSDVEFELSRCFTVLFALSKATVTENFIFHNLKLKFEFDANKTAQIGRRSECFDCKLKNITKKYSFEKKGFFFLIYSPHLISSNNGYVVIFWFKLFAWTHFETVSEASYLTPLRM